jgi:hypothetical protein
MSSLYPMGCDGVSYEDPIAECAHCEDSIWPNQRDDIERNDEGEIFCSIDCKRKHDHEKQNPKN